MSTKTETNSKLYQHGSILIAEDNHDDYFLVELACRRAGVTLPLIRVLDGMEAQDYLSGTGRFADRRLFPLPRMVIADLKMPRMTGLELLEWVRGQPYLRRIPFIMLSASGHQSDVNRAYDLAANSYLVKPTTLEELSELLKQVKSYWLSLNREPEVSSIAGAPV